MESNGNASALIDSEQRRQIVDAALTRVPGRSMRAGAEADPSVVTGPAVFNNVMGMFQSYAPMSYMLPFEILDYIELLARYNPDYSQAVDIVQNLANPGHTLIVDATKGVATRLKERFWEKDRQIQRRHGGLEGLIDKLINQAAVYGALAGEWVANEGMTDIVDFIEVNPKTIRFFWETNPNLDPWNYGPHWAPYQRATMQQIEQARKDGQEVKNGAYIKLNEITFQYFAFNAAPGSPYGVPPFLAALNNLSIQRDMMFNIAEVVRKLALLGLIDIKIEKLKPIAGESQDAFKTRATEYLTSFATLAANMLNDGGLVHYDDSEVTSTNLSGNAAGATNIFTVNEEQVFSGLKSMPSVAGRNYSTTETYAGVSYDIMIRNSLRYQRGVRMMLEYGYYLMAQLWGERVQKIELKFWQNKALQRKDTAQAEHYEILNELCKWAAGFTNQVDAAHALGYASPETEYDTVPDSPLFTASSSSKEINGESESPGQGEQAARTARGNEEEEKEVDEDRSREVEPAL